MRGFLKYIATCAYALLLIGLASCGVNLIIDGVQRLGQ